jgi:triosephosphate isomerase
MKKLFIAGSWKSFKGTAEAKGWFDTFEKLNREAPIKKNHLTTVLCPPYLLLPLGAERIKQGNLPIELGAQDVSHLGEGAYTGEISAKQLTEFVTWTIIGHSERRRNLGETDALLFQKVKEAKAHGLRIMYCVQDESIKVPEGVDVIAYEPPWAISAVSGWKAQNAESANRVCEKILSSHPGIPVIYGGSSSPDNVISYVSQSAISGVLSGGASLDPEKFFQMIERTTSVSV